MPCPRSQQANFPACSPQPPINAERQAGKLRMPFFKVLWYDSTRGMKPRSTDCEADALTTTPSRRLMGLFLIAIRKPRLRAEIVPTMKDLYWCFQIFQIAKLFAKFFYVIDAFEKRKVLIQLLIRQQISLQSHKKVWRNFLEVMKK